MSARAKNFLPKILFAAFAVLWVILAIDPLYRFDWFLENIAVFLALPLVVWSWFKFRLSNAAYSLIFVFAILHVAAAHYTYGSTPWGNWLSGYFGWERNHYDRIVHFLFGFIMAVVAREIISRAVRAKPALVSLFAFTLVFSVGALYEVAEFAVGVAVQPEKGLAFLGFQGDIWDTQKDIALQALGALLSLFIFRIKTRKDS